MTLLSGISEQHTLIFQRLARSPLSHPQIHFCQAINISCKQQTVLVACQCDQIGKELKMWSTEAEKINHTSNLWQKTKHLCYLFFPSLLLLHSALFSLHCRTCHRYFCDVQWFISELKYKTKAMTLQPVHLPFLHWCATEINTISHFVNQHVWRIKPFICAWHILRENHFKAGKLWNLGTSSCLTLHSKKEKISCIKSRNKIIGKKLTAMKMLFKLMLQFWNSYYKHLCLPWLAVKF